MVTDATEPGVTLVLDSDSEDNRPADASEDTIVADGTFSPRPSITMSNTTVPLNREVGASHADVFSGVDEDIVSNSIVNTTVDTASVVNLLAADAVIIPGAAVNVPSNDNIVAAVDADKLTLRLMPYRRSGCQYDINHVLSPQSPHDPIISATSTPYMSSTPVYADPSRELLSKGVGSGEVDSPSTPSNAGSIFGDYSSSESEYPIGRRRLLPPLNISSPSPLRLPGDKNRPTQMIEDAIKLLESKGYSCQMRPNVRSEISSGVAGSSKINGNTSSTAKKRKAGMEGTSVKTRRRLINRVQKQIPGSDSPGPRNKDTVFFCKRVKQLHVTIDSV